MSLSDTFALKESIKAEAAANVNSTSTTDTQKLLYAAPVLNTTLSANNPPSTFLSSLPGNALSAVSLSYFPQKTQTALAADQQAALQLPQSYFVTARANIQEFANNTADLFNLGDALYNTIFDRTDTLSPNTNLVTDDQYQVLFALEKALSCMDTLLSTNSFYKSTYPEIIASVNASFSDSPNLQTDPAVKQIQLPAGTSLERLALEQLGDPTRWGEIVELNSLKPPYISQNPADASATVKVPGNTILLPQPLINGFPNIPINDQNFLEQGLNEVQKNLGIDLQLTPDFDLLLTNSADLALSIAEKNVAQAIVFKLALERGDLLDHPELGVGIVAGQKIQSAATIQSSLIQTMSQDPRFDHISNVQVQIQGDTTNILFTVYIKNVDMPIPVTLKV